MFVAKPCVSSVKGQECTGAGCAVKSLPRKAEHPAGNQRGVAVVLSAVVSSALEEVFRAPRAAWQPRVYRRNRTYGSCLQQHTHTVTMGHGSPPFQSSDSTHVDARGHAQPSRGTSRETVGRDISTSTLRTLEAIHIAAWDTGLSMTLYYPPPGSSSRKRLCGNNRFAA